MRGGGEREKFVRFVVAFHSTRSRKQTRKVHFSGGKAQFKLFHLFFCCSGGSEMR